MLAARRILFGLREACVLLCKGEPEPQTAETESA